MESEKVKTVCCCICFVFVFIILIMAIVFTNYSSFETCANSVKYKNETFTNILLGGKHYHALSPSEDIQQKFSDLNKSKKTALVAILAPWCGYCKQLKSSGALKTVASKYDVIVMDDKHPQTEKVMETLKARGFPSLGFFSNGKLIPYDGERKAEDILHVMDSISGSSKSKCVIFMADWCGYCKQLKDSGLIEKLIDAGVEVQIEDDKSQLTKDLKIQGFPTIMIYKGEDLVPFKGERTLEGIMEEIKK